jgi:hypothetical protein
MKKSYSIQKIALSLMLGTLTSLNAQDDVNINMNINDGTGGAGVNMNVNVTGTGTQTQSTTSTTTTTTTTTSTGTGTNTTSTTESTDNSAAKNEAAVATTATTGCSTAASATDFQSAKASIQAKPFSDTKMILAKQIIKNNCFSVVQVKELMGLFTYEEEKVEIAKLCYMKTVDYTNYSQVNDAFTFSGSTDELSTYIDSVKR